MKELPPATFEPAIQNVQIRCNFGSSPCLLCRELRCTHIHRVGSGVDLLADFSHSFHLYMREGTMLVDSNTRNGPPSKYLQQPACIFYFEISNQRKV